MLDFNANISHSKPWITKKDIYSVNAVLNHGMIAQGALVKRFENSIVDYLKASAGVATNSGTSALLLALRALNVGNKSEVILPTYVCQNVLDAVITVGATPVLCDVGDQWVMTNEEVEPLISDKTVAIIAVHIFGLPVDVRALQSLGVLVIEDACQAFGLCIDGNMAGTIGDVGILSFHATKCITTAEGGMLVSDNTLVINNARKMRDGCRGINVRMPVQLSDMQAALGLSQLSRYQDFITRRRVLKSKYTEALESIKNIELVNKDVDFLFRFPLRTRYSLDKVQSGMQEHLINVRRGVDQLLHRQLGISDDKFPNAILAYEQTVSIPFYPALSNKQSDKVLDVLMEICC